MRKWYPGLLAGFMSINLFTVTYVVAGGREALSLWLSYATLIFYIGAAYWAAKRSPQFEVAPPPTQAPLNARIEKPVVGRVRFRPALKAAFGNYVLGLVVWYGFIYLMFNYVDTDLLTLDQQLTMERLEQFGGFESERDRLQFMEQTYGYGLSDALLGLARSSIMGFVFAFGAAFVVSWER